MAGAPPGRCCRRRAARGPPRSEGPRPVQRADAWMNANGRAGRPAVRPCATRGGPASVRQVKAPVDPRADWALPALGALPRTTDLEPLVSRVLAPNPSGMTLDGTN